MDILNENPLVTGTYVAYVDHEFTHRWAKRIFLIWDDGWFYPSSDQRYRSHVYGFIGPLPAMELED